ncbi:protein indeterminate-domain 12 [Diospyros lotus]|uniref:protein indeterminate-domain 12 n=1 Tax=Diospyros lotus TaxID=55363 RepID=UPI00225BAF80|nr:protein indeterminate-domain 12 [Diospyros lotus]
MFPSPLISNSTSLSEEATSFPSGLGGLNPTVSTLSIQQPQKIKKKRSLPGNPDPDAEVIALSPKTLLATNRFVCEICNKGFQRDQNLQLHRRGHNLPWKLKQRNSKENRKKAYVCPEPSCVHHHPSRALGDLTGIKKHFCRKHGEKKWKCEKCSKVYAVQSDWKAHSKTCGTREYRCDCGTLFSRKDSFITHRAFCDALAEESARMSASQMGMNITNLPINNAQPFHQPPPLFPFSTQNHHHLFPNSQQAQAAVDMSLNTWDQPQNPKPSHLNQTPIHIKPEAIHMPIPPRPRPPIVSAPFFQDPPPATLTHKNHLHAGSSSSAATSAHLSATALLQKAASFGAQPVGHVASAMTQLEMGSGTGIMPPEYLGFTSNWQKSDSLTRDFLGLTRDQCGGGGGGGDERFVLSFPAAGRAEVPTLFKAQSFSETWGNC